MEKKLWETIANQCAPVLMGVKPSNLLILTREEERTFDERQMPEGLSCLCLYRGEKKSTWLLYRADRLAGDVAESQTKEFLAIYGYDVDAWELGTLLNRLRARFTAYKTGNLTFPHELGVFLGYPLCDVKGFIEHQGKNYLCSGYWKVYGDVAGARKTFQLYQTVRDALLQMISAGEDLQGLGFPA